MDTESHKPNGGSAVWGGAQLGWQLTGGYSLFFLVIAVLRSSVTILEFPPDKGLAGLLLANALCLAWAVAVFTVAAALAAVLLGMTTGFILEKLVGKLQPGEKAYQGALAGLLVASLILIAIQLFPYVGWKLQVQTIPSATLWFWFVVPDILYLLSSSLAGWVIQTRRRSAVKT